MTEARNDARRPFVDRPLGRAVAVAATAAACALASFVARRFAHETGVAFLYPSAAVALAATGAFGIWGALGVGLGSALAPWGAADTPFTIVLFASIQAAAGLIAARALRDATGGAYSRLSRVVVWGAMLPDLFSAVAGVSALVTLGHVPVAPGAIASSVATWWASDVVAALVLGLPLLLALRPGLLLIAPDRGIFDQWLRSPRQVLAAAVLTASALVPAFVLPRLGWGFPHWLTAPLAAGVALAALQGGSGAAILVNGFASAGFIAALAAAPTGGLALEEILTPAYGSVVVLSGFALLGGWMSNRRRRLLDTVRSQQLQLRRDFETTVASLAAAIEAKDPLTEGHVQRVAQLAQRVGRKLGIAGQELDHLRWAAILHDIGKIGVPEAVLNKPGPLDEAEKLLMQRHVEIGLRIVRDVVLLRPAEPAIRYHQERWDGRREGVRFPGYFGLCGDEIPVGARILAVVDAFDAITHDRPYRQGRPTAAAVAELRAESDLQFDRQVVEALVEIVREEGWTTSAEIDASTLPERVSRVREAD
ncbi:MAG: HD-GYP domain-containing protein [Acidobacteriota bacterium]